MSASANKPNFNEDHMKYIAEFYVQHYEYLTAHAGMALNKGINEERQRLFRELTAGLNTKYGTKFGYEQIHRKLKNMKRNARLQIQQAEYEQRPVLGCDPDTPILMEAEELIVAKLLQVAQEQRSLPNGQKKKPAIGTVRRGVTTTSSIPVPSASSNLIGSSRNEAHAAVHTIDTSYDAHRDESPDRRLANGQSPPRKRRRRRFAANPDAAKAEPHSPDKAYRLLKMSVLRLQKQVMENELELQADKKATMTKVSIAVDEFRRYVAESRMNARGFNLSTIPVDIPPGMEDVVGQM